VLGAFLGMGGKFGSVPLVRGGGGAARARASERTNLHRVANQPDMHLRRASNKREIRTESASRTDSSRGELETKHVRRRVDETKASIKIERITAEIGFEALRQDNLEDVARPNVLLGSLYCALELAPLKIALRWM